MHTRDDFLMRSLASWLRNLHSAPALGNLQEYVEKNRIGCSPLPVSDPFYSHIVRRMRESTAKFGCRYKLLGIRLVVDHDNFTK